MNENYVMVHVDTLHGIVDRLERIELHLQGKSTGLYVTREDICRELDKSPSWLTRAPWCLPNFGVPDIPGKPEKWTRDNWEKWRDKLPEHQREFQRGDYQRRAV